MKPGKIPSLSHREKEIFSQGLMIGVIIGIIIFTVICCFLDILNV
ncbi:MAG: hypothetical protein ACFFDK_13135 [Promethearchaeota archaeon]